MKRVFKNIILSAIKPFERRGLVLSRRDKNIPKSVLRTIQSCSKKSFCKFSHFEMAWRAIRYIESSGIEGDVVLCGVATGGLAKSMIDWLDFSSKTLWLYDTFDGGTLPGKEDGNFERKHGELAKKKMSTSYEEVKSYVEYDSWVDTRWVVGDILQTIPAQVPEKISLLYLDTDYYETTKHELIHLEPLVANKGIIIFDDYFLYEGTRKAVAEYYQDKKMPFIIPIDELGAVCIKA